MLGPSAFEPWKWHFNIDEYLNPWIPSPPLHRLPRPVSHFLGHRPKPQRAMGNLAMIFWAFVGVFCGIMVIEATTSAVPLFREHGAPIIIGSFGAAAVLEFYTIESPLAQPRNAVLGQVFSSIVGVAVAKLFALSPAWLSATSPSSTSTSTSTTTTDQHLVWLGGALACACAVAVMALTATVHPPAGATALLAVVDGGARELGWYLVLVVMLSCALMQAVALIVNNVQRRFPVYWWTPEEVGQRWRRRRPVSEERGGDVEKGPDAEAGRPGVHQDTDEESTARIVMAASPQTEGTEDQEKQVILTRGQVSLPEGMYVTPEEKLLLEELSERL